MCRIIVVQASFARPLRNPIFRLLSHRKFNKNPTFFMPPVSGELPFYRCGDRSRFPSRQKDLRRGDEVRHANRHYGRMVAKTLVLGRLVRILPVLYRHESDPLDDHLSLRRLLRLPMSPWNRHQVMPGSPGVANLATYMPSCWPERRFLAEPKPAKHRSDVPFVGQNGRQIRSIQNRYPATHRRCR